MRVCVFLLNCGVRSQLIKLNRIYRLSPPKQHLFSFSLSLSVSSEKNVTLINISLFLTTFLRRLKYQTTSDRNGI